MIMVAENQAKVTCCPVQIPYMAAEDRTVPRSLKFKVTSKGIWNASENKLCEKTVKDVVNNGQRCRATGGGRKRSVVNVLVKASLPVKSGKRRPETPVDGQIGKKQKIDRTLKLQLNNILKELMNHRAGYIFNEPVDPEKLNIPDYFSVITQPMDLGTIKHKLEENKYFSATEFAADVRLTFANAMLYNPPSHEVHYWAKMLAADFSRKWKVLVTKLKHGNKNDEEASFFDYMKSNGQNTEQIAEKNQHKMKPIGRDTAPFSVKVGTSKPMSLEEKQKFRLELVQALSKQMIEKLQAVCQKFGLMGLDKERLDSYIDSTDDETLWKLRREVKVLLGSRGEKVKSGKVALNGCSSLNITAEKEHRSQSALASEVSANHQQSIDSTEAKCSSCFSLKCHCHKNCATQGSGSDITSERSSGHNYSGDSKLESEFKYPLASLTSSFGLDSDGESIAATTPASVEGWTFDVQMSPKKALRAAMLKSRFADTIFRATHQTLLDHGEKSGSLRMQQERERLEREQLKEKAKIEAQIKAAEEASRRREQDDLKMQRERERKAARIVLEKMEKVIEIHENAGILKDLEIMDCGYLFNPHDRMHRGNPLKQLGLFIKDNFLEGDEDAILDGEEGEILS